MPSCRKSSDDPFADTGDPRLSGCPTLAPFKGGFSANAAAIAMKQRLITVANAIAVFAALLMLWQLVLWIFHVPPFMLPSPLAVGRAVIARFPSLLASFAITAEESAGGLAASIIVGVLIALVFAQSRWVRRMLYPYTLLLQTVPIVAMAPLILMWVGARHARGHADRLHHFTRADHRQHHAGTDQRGRKSREPFPDAQRLARADSFQAAPAARGAVAFCGHSHRQRHRRDRRHHRRAVRRLEPRGQGGLGYSILYASSQLQTDYLFALVLAAAVLGFAFLFLVMFFEWYFLHKWHESARAPETA